MKAIDTPGSGAPPASGPAPFASAPVARLASERPKVGYFRWGICALLLFSTTINYVDRQVIGILKPTLSTVAGDWLSSFMMPAVAS